MWAYIWKRISSEEKGISSEEMGIYSEEMGIYSEEMKKNRYLFGGNKKK